MKGSPALTAANATVESRPQIDLEEAQGPWIR